ncbi:MAG: bifunctional adenosylcobinamide kinase/adenosylcobinamide-phosphate guanylyltransferase [Actinomycetota bacterium]|nr:bifunctional adenosylcobinamide kinase/adenosylcobinamide-phosphate guanylyltransferase [Actinomycetota bacterium]
MRVRLLGTGASDGWPDPWCACASCAAAVAQGVLRGQTGALVDERLLLDLGPELPRAALRQGTSLAAVEAVLVTHAHEDHLAPAALMWRSWQPDPRPLTVVGPPAVLALAGRRADPSVALREVRAGDRLAVAGYEVVVLPARHGGADVGPAVLYDVTGPDGARLLYATDTGVLPEAALPLAQGRAYDLVLLELSTMALDTHLDLTTWPQQVERLRGTGAVTPATQVVAVHLGHGNPPPDVLDRLLASWGARAGRDGEVVELGRTATRRVLVLGGARSGKSAYAESVVAAPLTGSATRPVTYVATAPERPGDEEWAARVRAHAERRPAGWRTVETADVAGALRRAEGPLLVDDLGLWLTRVLDEADAWERPGPAVQRAVDDLLAAWRDVQGLAVLVAPEVGGGVVPATRSGRVFRDLLGEVTRRLAAGADEVVQVVAGIPRRLA